MLRGFERKIKPMDIVSAREVEQIHKETLKVLERTGINFLHQNSLELMKDGGCSVDSDTKRVKIPGWLVEECIKKTPGSFELKARDRKNDLNVGGNRLYYLAGAGMRIADLDTWEARAATLKELDEATVVNDALDSVHLVADTGPYTDIVDVPPIMASLFDIASHLRNTTKITIVDNGNNYETFHIKMAEVVGCDMLPFIGSSAPLTYDEATCEAVFRYSEVSFPFFLISSDMMGGTSPATIAGSLVTTNAEILAGVVLIQLLKPGTGIIAGDYAMPLDMRSGHPCFCDLGSALHTAAFTQIMRRYDIPAFANCPGMSSSKEIDVQSGYERAMSTLAAALFGAHMIVLHGTIYGEYSYHPVGAVLDDDIATWAGRMIEGFYVNKETLAGDLIDEVGPIPGSFLNTPHTRKWWKSQRFMPKTADRLSYPEWMKADKKTAIEYAKDRVEEILSSHRVPPLAKDQDEEINNILKEAQEYYKKKGLL
ncbi:MAG: trimethylamine methyltransferase family protein [Spirochaetota bacterium]|nr:MAG: trimethylamine methyltransferase family protein [Spirochaetota bacterium]